MFKELVEGINKYGEPVTDGEDHSVILSELVLSLDEDNNPDSVMFSALGIVFALSPLDEVFLILDDEDEKEVVEEGSVAEATGELKDSLTEFLKWRIEALNKFES